MTTFLAKYHPQSLVEFMFHGDVVEICQQLLEMNMLNVLIVGAPGTGKTTFLEALLQQYYEPSHSHQNVQNMMDNVLHTSSFKEQGATTFRSDLVLFCRTFSTVARKKRAVVVDDMDQIAENCQQVLRQCIDRNSERVLFLCSCTNLVHVHESIQSRLLVVKLLPPTTCEMGRLFDRVCLKENMLFETAARATILSLSDHNVKSMLCMLEKLSLLQGETSAERTQVISDSYARASCNASVVRGEELDRFFAIVQNKRLTQPEAVRDSVRALFDLSTRGLTVLDIVDGLLQYVRTSSEIADRNKYALLRIFANAFVAFYELHESEVELVFVASDVVTFFANHF